MFDISISELLIIFLVLIIFVGPKNLSTIAKAFGKISGKVKNFFNNVKEEIEREDNYKELKKIEKEIKERSNKS
jgi:sec-independent protein translocase protein TatB|tara:strand:- start:1676 stop:1897 length:222 start_codon:yes stop_codon:yes gene_type:complete